MEKDSTGIKLGMWLFLYTEIMLFGGLFVLYGAYSVQYTADFIQGGKELNLTFGIANTIILLVSSFTVAASITAVQRGSNALAQWLLWSSVFMGGVFLVNKYFEWSYKFSHEIYPGSDLLADGEPGRNIFYGLYYVITGLHGLHIVVGMILLTISAVSIMRKRITPEDYGLVENCGLYWHLVDLIWIFVFPLFYLIV